MIGAVIVTHGRLAEELVCTLDTIIGSVPQIKAVGTSLSQTSDEIWEKIEKALKENDTGEGVLLLTDMFGGTPSNICMSFLGKKNVEVISGVNMPMLIKFASCRGQMSLSQLKDKMVTYGRENILLASEILKANKADKSASQAKSLQEEK